MHECHDLLLIIPTHFRNYYSLPACDMIQLYPHEKWLKSAKLYPQEHSHGGTLWGLLATHAVRFISSMRHETKTLMRNSPPKFLRSSLNDESVLLFLFTQTPGCANHLFSMRASLASLPLPAPRWRATRQELDEIPWGIPEIEPQSFLLHSIVRTHLNIWSTWIATI